MYLNAITLSNSCKYNQWTWCSPKWNRSVRHVQDFPLSQTWPKRCLAIGNKTKNEKNIIVTAQSDASVDVLARKSGKHRYQTQHTSHNQNLGTIKYRGIIDLTFWISVCASPDVLSVIFKRRRHAEHFLRPLAFAQSFTFTNKSGLLAPILAYHRNVDMSSGSNCKIRDCCVSWVCLTLYQNSS